MQLRTHGYVAGRLLEWSTAQIYVSTEAGEKAWTDNRPFTIELVPVIHDYTEHEGGALRTRKRPR